MLCIIFYSLSFSIFLFLFLGFGVLYSKMSKRSADPVSCTRPSRPSHRASTPLPSDSAFTSFTSSLSSPQDVSLPHPEAIVVAPVPDTAPALVPESSLHHVQIHQDPDPTSPSPLPSTSLLRSMLRNYFKKEEK